MARTDLAGTRIDGLAGIATQAAQQTDAKASAIGTDLSPTAEIGTNQYGGQSSKLAARFDLLDRAAIDDLLRGANELREFRRDSVDAFVDMAIDFAFDAVNEIDDVRMNLGQVQFNIYGAVARSLGAAEVVKDGPFPICWLRLHAPALFRLAEVLGYGAAKYTVNNWRAVPVNEHLNHMLVHLFAYLGGDTQDDHLGHAFCRAHMALAVHYQGAPWIIGDDGVPRPQEREAA